MSPSSAYTVKMLVTQLCPTLCDPKDCSPPACSVHGILQARILEWVAIPFSVDISAPRTKPRSPALRADSLSYEPTWKPLQVYSGILLYSGSQSFSRFGLLLLLLFRIFSLFWLIVGLPSVPGRWYKWMKQTWWQFLGIAGDCDFMSKSKKGPFQCHA